MQHHIIAPALYVCAGISIYATVVHSAVALQDRSSRRLHGLFGTLTALLTVFIVFHIISLKATDIATLAWGLRGSITIGYISLTVLLWFIAGFTQQHSPRLLLGLNGVLLFLAGLNWFSPYSLQFGKIISLTTLELPWGESITRGIGSHPRAFLWGMITVIISYVYIIFAFQYSKPRYGLRPLKFAVYFYLINLALGILARLGLIKILEPGAFAWIGMILTMSFILIREHGRQLINSENRFRALVEQSPLSIQILNRQGKTIQTNPAWHKLWNGGNLFFPNADPSASPFLMMIQSELQQVFAGQTQTLAPQQYLVPHETSMKSHWLRGHLYPLQTQDTVEEVVILQEDVTEQTQMENAMHILVEEIGGAVGDRFFEQLVKGLAKIFQVDYVLIGLIADYALVGLIDLDLSPRSGMTWEKLQISTLAVCAQGQLVSNLTYSLKGTPCATVLDDRKSCIYSCQVQQLFPEDHLLGEMRAESYVGTPLTNSKGELLGIMVMVDSQPMENPHIARTIFELFALRAGAEIQRLQDEAHIRRMAYEDYLTRLPNRAQLHQMLGEVLHRSLRSKSGGALLMIDLDHFKTINDALGHDVGDEVLRSVARRLEEFEREQTFVARLGGDEFVVLLTREEVPHAHVIEGEAIRLAQRIIHKLSSPIYVGERSLNLGASVGISLFPEDGVTELDVLRRADMALYRAKRLGRGILQVYHPELQEAANDRLWLEEGLRRVIENHELALHFQPQVTAQGEMVGAEVLLRWYHPDVGTISPDRFIPVAEETGLIHSIGHWVLEQSCQRLKQWEREHRWLQGHLSVNVCPWQFSRLDFVDQVQEILETYQINPQFLVLEVTETALLYDLAETIEKLNLFRAKGIKIALDDFGTGYSSLAHLKDLPIDILKIDKAFVQDLNHNAKHCLAESILAISHLMELDVVAEGVETMKQRDLLIQFGCEIFQGYFFGRPLPEPDFLAWLQEAQSAKDYEASNRINTAVPLILTP